MYILETVAGVIILIVASYALGWRSAVRNYRGKLTHALRDEVPARPYDATAQDEAALRMLAYSNVGNGLTLPSGRYITGDEFRALSAYYRRSR